jgi:hypothetical protein
VDFLVAVLFRPVLGPTQPSIHGYRRLSVGNMKVISVPSSAKVKNEWRVTLIFPYVLMTRCVITGTVITACI